MILTFEFISISLSHMTSINKNFTLDIKVQDFGNIGNQFKLMRRINGGAFGEIYLGKDIINNVEVIVKVEKVDAVHPQLRHEYKVYRELQGCPGITEIEYYGIHKNYHVLVMEHLGNSLSDLLKLCNMKFTLYTVLEIADQLITRVQDIHERSLIHRDIKPENMMMGMNDNKSVLYLIDFGLAKLYRDQKTLKVSPFSYGKGFAGTPRYAALHTHNGIRQSPRDDLESIGYNLVYFLKGNLPWQGITLPRKEKYEKIRKMKQTISIDKLCDDLPKEFKTFFNYVKSLKYEDVPKYSILRDLFKILKSTLQKPKLMFDWENLLAGFPIEGTVGINKRKHSDSEDEESEEINNSSKYDFFIANDGNENVQDDSDEANNLNRFSLKKNGDQVETRDNGSRNNHIQIEKKLIIDINDSTTNWKREKLAVNNE